MRVFTCLVNFTLSTLVIASVTIAGAQDEAETDFKSTPAPSTRTTETLNEKIDDVSLSGDLEDADNTGYQGVANDASAEEHRLKLEIRNLEREVIQLRSGKEKAVREAELAQKRLTLQQKRYAEAKKVHQIALKEKQKADQKKDKVVAQLKKLEAEESSLKQQTKVLAQLTREDEVAHQNATKKIQRTQASITQERRAQSTMQKKRARLKKQQ